MMTGSHLSFEKLDSTFKQPKNTALESKSSTRHFCHSLNEYGPQCIEFLLNLTFEAYHKIQGLIFENKFPNFP